MVELAFVFGLVAAIFLGSEGRSTVLSVDPDPPNASGLSQVYNVEKGIIAPELAPLQVNLESSQDCPSRVNGTVVLSFVVDATGVARDLGFERATSSPLDGIAHKIVGADRFKPATKDGIPVSVSMQDEIDLEACISESKDAQNHIVRTGRILAQPVQRVKPFKMNEKDLEYALAGAGTPIEHVGPRTGVSAPMPTNTVEAEFSDEARLQRINAVVVAKVVVDPQGFPRCARITKPAGFGLDEKALEAVRKYRFKPAMKNGVPVPVMIAVQIVFRIT